MQLGLSIIDLFQRGLTDYRAGRLLQAEAAYRQILTLDPAHADAHYALGAALWALGRPAEAEVSCREVVRLRPNNPEAHNNLGGVLKALGRLAEAEASHREAVRLRPNYPEAHYNLGTALWTLGRLAEAEASYREAVRLRPNYPEAHYNLGAMLNALGRPAEGEASYREAVRLRPNYPEAHYNLGNALCALGRPAEGEASYRNALRLRPNYPEAHNNLGNALWALGRLAEAEASYRNALRLRPNNPEAHINLGNALCALGRPAEAEVSCREVVRLRPNSPQAHRNLGNVLHALNRWRESIACLKRLLSLKPDDPLTKFALCMAELPVLYADEAEIAERRASYAARLKSLASEVADMPAAALADGIGRWQPFFLPYQGHNDRDLQAIYGALACRVMADRYPPVAMPPPPAPDERVRVGIVSGYFRRHANWRIPIQGWLGQLDRSRFRLFGYYTDAVSDAETERARSLCDRFVQGPLSIDRWRQEIAADAPQVLLYPEVGMSPISAKLAAQRLAPVQCNSWGHPETSGFPTLDYFLSSDLMEPSDAQQHYCENLIRLPNLSVYCEPVEPPVLACERAAFGMRSSACIYWCAQSLFKYLPRHDPIFPRIAREAGDCQFVFIEYPGVTDLFRLRLERAFGQFGLRAEDYCLFLPRLDQERFLAATGLSDVFLDSIGWSGCNSTLEALVYDLPIVTLRGDLMRGRHSAAMLDMMGMTATVCESIEQYAELAVDLARDPARRAELKRMIATGKRAIYRDRTCIAALEEFLDQVARRAQAK
ncbi:MAG: tetratricopeptide repeat protein [Alphaproteobacteria bacterium]|nr:tetratricopeptide repeat protein [Alphaproteobacteria bacterium]